MKTLLIILAIATIEVVAVLTYISISITHMAQQGVNDPLPASVVVNTGQQEVQRVQGTLDYQQYQRAVANGALKPLN